MLPEEMLVARVQHGRVACGGAQFRVLLVEGAVAFVEEVYLRVVERGVVLLVFGSV